MSELNNIIQQLTNPIFLNGDLNAQYTIWGSLSNNKIRKTIEYRLNDEDYTYFCQKSEIFSNIYLTFCSPRIYPNLTHTTSDYVYESGHSSNHYIHQSTRTTNS